VSYRSKAHNKESAAWLGRNVAMPAARGAAKPLEWLLNKIYAPAGAAVGKYRSGLRAAGNAPRDVDAIIAAKRDIPGTYFGAEHEDLLRAAVEKATKKQRIYGGAGMAAVGIPALAGVFGGAAASRRRRAEEELEAALSEKGASVSFANQLGTRLGKRAETATKPPVESGVNALARVPGREYDVKPKPKFLSLMAGSIKKHPYIAAGSALGAAGVGTGIGLSVRSHRRKKKKKEEKAKKEANVSFAHSVGLRAGMSKKALLPQIGETVSPAIARILELVGAKSQGAELRGLAGRSQFLRGAVGGLEPEQAKGVLKGTHIYEPYSSMGQLQPGHNVELRTLNPYSSMGQLQPGHNVGLRTLNEDLAARKTMRNIGLGTAATGAGVVGGAIGGIAGGVHSKKKKSEGKKPEKKEKKEAQLGTPFMDGFLLQCAETGLNESQVADVIEKAAQLDNQIGEECRVFLDRLVAVK